MGNTGSTEGRRSSGYADPGTRAAARLAWTLWAACAVLVALTILLRAITDDTFPFAPWERFDPRFAALTEILSLAFPTVGALIASRLPRNPIGWLFCGVGLLYAMHRFTAAYADYTMFMASSLPGGEYAAWFSNLINLPVLGLSGIFLALLFPGGWPSSRLWRVVAAVAILGAALLAIGEALMPIPLRTFTYIPNPFGVSAVIGGGWTTYQLLPTVSLLGTTLLIVGSIGALVSLVVRLHGARGNERQQIKWFLYAALPATASMSLMFAGVAVTTLTEHLLFRPLYIYPVRVEVAINYATLFFLTVVPVFTYVAILRYRLYDIDLVINRTIVYGSLTACVVGIYVLAVGALGALFQAGGNLAVSLLATGAVAILFQPLRDRLQRAVNRLMYGERDDPYAATSRLGRRLEATLAPEAVLPTVVETVAQALKLPHVALQLREGVGYRTAADFGSPTAEPEVLPLVYQGEEVGRLVVSPRAPGEGFSDADRRLLGDLVRQAEVAVQAVRLTADLQRSRERLVTAREEERKRLRRDLHDGVGPTLTGLALQLNAARKMVAGDRAEDAGQTLASLEKRTQETIADMRRLVYGLRPPALDDLGLVASIRQQAYGQGMIEPTGETTGNPEAPVFSVQVPDPLPPLPAAVEVACYRIAQEAITNVSRHASAGRCRVRISVDEEAAILQLEISDDGLGIPEDRTFGVGLSSMRERADELGGTLTIEPGRGGGTRVLARLPLTAAAYHPEGAVPSWNARSVSS